MFKQREGVSEAETERKFADCWERSEGGDSWTSTHMVTAWTGQGENSGLLVYEAVSLDEQIWTFRTVIVPLFLGLTKASS